VAYLRTSIGEWKIDLDTDEATRIFERIHTEGVAVFRREPGFVRYRLMRADRRTTVAVAEWESEALGRPGAERYREWLRESGIWDLLTLKTLAGEIVAAS
jgi:hypothetical protein